MARTALLVDDNAVFARQLEKCLAACDVETTWLTHGARVPAALDEREYDVAIVEAVMPGLGGTRLLDYLRSHAPHTRVVMTAASASLETAVMAMKRGAVDYLVKPMSPEVLAGLVRDLADEGRDDRPVAASDGFEGYQHELVGQCGPMHDVFAVMDKVAQSDAPVLICGESGTGKELVARAIHRRSRRGGSLFLAVNCGALAEGVLDSELFGHVRGAFTGARSARRGLFEQADKGVIFLDEIPSTPLGFQVKLLRVLEDGVVRPVGASSSVRTDVRVVAATNVDLREAVRSGRFRDDLYYRLNVVSIQLPPLRDRGGDIELLANHFVARASRDVGAPASRITPVFLEALLQHRWPGNVRELRNVIERAVLLAEDGELTPDLLPDDLKSVARAQSEIPPYGVAKRAALKGFQRDYLGRLLRRYGGNITQAAEAAEVPRQTLHRLLRDLEIGAGNGIKGRLR